MRGRVFMAAAILALGACGRTAAVPPAPVSTPTPAPTRDPSRDGLPLVAAVSLAASAHTFQGGDDHVTLTVDNRGRDIRALVISTGAWIDEHGLAMGTTRSCVPDLERGTVACGPVFAGQSAAFILRAYPAHEGTYHYQFSLFDEEDGRMLPVAGPAGAPVLLEFDEVVDAQTNQVPGYHPEPSPSTSS